MKIKIRPNIYQLNSSFGAGIWGANVFLLVDNNNLTLIDTGFKGRAGGILSEIKKMGYVPSDITRILVTHHHIDHVGSLAALKRTTGAAVLAHPADIPYINGELPHPGPIRRSVTSKILALALKLWATSPLDVDIPVNDGDELPIMGGIKVVHTPGTYAGMLILPVAKRRRGDCR